MSHVLIVDDSLTDRVRAGKLLEKSSDFTISYAVDGDDAISQIESQPPDVVVTDLQMPGRNGLELVESVRRDFPSLPVILMTAQGSEEIATEALRIGAASYVPKAMLPDHLHDTVERVLDASMRDRMHTRLMHSLESSDSVFVIQNDLQLADQLAAHIQEMLRCLPLEDESERLRVGLAVKHAVAFLQYVGNFEIDLSVGQETTSEFAAIVDERSENAPFCDRKIRVRACISPDQAEFELQHEGPGIVSANLPIATELQLSCNPAAHSLLMVTSIVDDWHFDANGQLLTLLKRSSFSDDDFVVESDEDELDSDRT